MSAESKLSLNKYLPDFLGIGAQKSATSWLYKVLDKHPDVFVPVGKELHFFNENINNGLDHYVRQFEGAGNKIKGEITPAYAILKLEEIDFIRKCLPEVKLIYLMRNPIDRAWSMAKMHYRETENKTPNQITDDEFIKHFNSQASISRGDYYYCLSNWYQVFPKERILLGYYEEVLNSPEQLIRRVFKHIGADPDKFKWNDEILKQVVFQGAKRKIPDHLKLELVKIYRSRLEKLYELLNDDQIAIWLETMRE